MPEPVKSFTMLRSYYDGIRNLPYRRRTLMYDAVMDYAFSGARPDVKDPVVRMGLEVILPTLESSLAYHRLQREKSEKGAAASAASRKKRKTAEAETTRGCEPENNPRNPETVSGPSPRDSEETSGLSREGESEGESERECESEGEKMVKEENDAAQSRPRKRERKSPFGEYGNVRLTTAEFERLKTVLGEDELFRCIRYVDDYTQCSGKTYKDWSAVIRRCSRDGWGQFPKNLPQLHFRDRVRKSDEYAASESFV